MWVDFDVRGQQQMHFFRFIWITDSYFGLEQWLQVFHAAFHLTRHELMDSNRVDYLWITVMFFISCLNSNSDGTHSLQRIHWWASYVMQNFSKSVLMNKEINLHLRWPEGECIFSTFVIFIFWANYSFKVRLRVRCGVKFTLRLEQQTLKDATKHSSEDHCADTHTV